MVSTPIPTRQVRDFQLAACARLGLNPEEVSRIGFEVMGEDEGTLHITAHIPGDEVLAMFNGTATPPDPRTDARRAAASLRLAHAVAAGRWDELHRLAEAVLDPPAEAEEDPTARWHDVLGERCRKCGVPADDIPPDTECPGGAIEVPRRLGFAPGNVIPGAPPTANGHTWPCPLFYSGNWRDPGNRGDPALVVSVKGVECTCRPYLDPSTVDLDPRQEDRP